MDDNEVRARGNAAIEMVERLAQETPDENLMRACQLIDSLYRLRQQFKAAPPDTVTTDYVLISFDVSTHEAIHLYDLLEGVPMAQVRTLAVLSTAQEGNGAAVEASLRSLA